MELICPSCEARYQVPGGSIGEKGRQVSCMNCGHSWHAYPPLVLGTPDNQPSQQRGLDYQGPQGQPRPAPKTPVLVDPAEESETRKTPELAGNDSPPPVQGDSSRSEQLAEIREMLAEVQSEDRAAAALTPEPVVAAPKAPKPAAPVVPTESLTAPIMAAASERQAPDPRMQEDARRAEESRIAEEEEAYRDRAARLQNKPEKAKPTDVKKLQRSHDRRIKREKAAAKAGSGAFLTGLLLVAIIAAVMISLYVLHPQIIQRMPGSEAALTEYVSTIDSMRVSLAETVDGVQNWVSSRFGDDDA